MGTMMMVESPFLEILKMCRCGAYGYGLVVDLAVLGGLDLKGPFSPK